MELNLKDKTAFVTGASRGIGASIKRTLEECGANVIAPTRSEMDLLSKESIKKYFDKNNNLKVDIFIHCAGINLLAGIQEISDEIIENVFQVNVYSAIQILKYLSSDMVEKKNGKVVLVSSLYSIVSRERRIAYSASKNALTGFMKSVAIELGKDNILINSIAPGYVMTEMTKKNLSEEEIKNIENSIPTGRFQTEEDIASLVAFLCSDYNQSITGQLIAVDGGFTCK